MIAAPLEQRQDNFESRGLLTSRGDTAKVIERQHDLTRDGFSFVAVVFIEVSNLSDSPRVALGGHVFGPVWRRIAPQSF